MSFQSDFAALPRAVRRVYNHPWARWRRVLLTRKQRRKLREFLDAHGRITPNFTWIEARSKPNPQEPRGAAVPPDLRRNAIRHAWKLEQLRHAVGDQALTFLSWYRTPIHNRHVEGAQFSRHMQADATDFTPTTVTRVGRPLLMREANRIWDKGGVGDYPSGAVHTDSRGVRARWSSF
jgi:hypothetical protein